MGSIMDIKSLMGRIGSGFTLREAEEYDRNLRGNNFEIKEYWKGTTSFDEYIKPNHKAIYQFMENGYQAANVGSFEGCFDAKSLKKNSSLVKIAFNNGDWVAIAIYTAYRGGQKCIGVTATTDSKIRHIGKLAVKQIVKDDIANYDKFYWCECSGKLEEYYTKGNAIAIPNEYANEIVGNVNSLDPDGFHYQKSVTSKNGTGSFRKILFGFNTPEMFTKICEKYREYINQRIETLKRTTIIENAPSRDLVNVKEWQFVLEIVQLFVEFYQEGTYDYPQECLTLIQECVDYLKDGINQQAVPDFMVESTHICIRNGEFMLSIFSPLTLNEL